MFVAISCAEVIRPPVGVVQTLPRIFYKHLMPPASCGIYVRIKPIEQNLFVIFHPSAGFVHFNPDIVIHDTDGLPIR